ncbi:transcription-repair coupling factor [Mahella australiensis]|uniref:Transcription-repair-coupling factor n=1 Tax=Mahella australiensis (strain DSM 15567 / CIP 107919 / 50-1 BON) TaxID=697281 RepID=F4A1G2_MAHA5|nr:transcription-repair coupling factor [Mahella australiensis]AEE95996.1 transcription-repair coupling factor [Mahella australiensis 50-1 BON]
MSDLLTRVFERSDISKRIHDSLRNDSDRLEIYGVPDEGRAYLMYVLVNIASSKSAIVITHNEVRAKQLYDDMSSIFKDIPVYLFPAAETILYDVSGKSNEVLFQRLEIENRLAFKENMIVIASIDALLPRLMPFEEFNKYFHEISIGQIIERDVMERWLLEAGYQREELVEAKGQFAIRGDIIDFYPIVGEEAYRIEFFDDEVDSIRRFDADTQRSTDKVDKAVISPVKELVYDSGVADRAAKAMRSEFERINGNDQIGGDIELLSQNARFENVERYMPFFYNKVAGLLDYMPTGTLFFMEEEERIRQRNRTLHEEFEQVFKALLIKGEVLPSQAYLLSDYDALCSCLNRQRAVMLETFHQAGTKPSIKIDAKKIPSFQGNMDIIVDELRQWKSAGYTIIIATLSDNRGLRIQDMLQQSGIEAWFTRRLDIDMRPGQICIIDMPLSSGTEWPDIKCVILTDQELFGMQRRRSKVKTRKAGQRVTAFSDLNIGDYVVHENYGIGQYMGIKKLTVEGKSRDYLFIRYADGDNLYVPTDRMSLVQRYIGGDGASPRLSKLGGSEWSKTKAKVRESVRKMAGELLKLYASRYTTKGHAFSPDTVWQAQLEESFPYQETPDQLQAIEEIKADMESDKPMDRLLCGDVGYGKTEVALRAAFKAVMDGKQVAVLVPTTVLAQQHYNTFTNRLAGFPIKVDVISRFRSVQEQKDIVKGLKSGDIDIIIGTHALLSSNVKFHDLGLLIVDEEQRFGVSHKEAIKRFKNNVDVLTLTATPIPRTLHMSLSGIRDISIIETPPEDRYPVQTYVVEYDENIIRDAILKELGRGGQVYFVYNRINSIDVMAIHLHELVPEARIAVAHGRMGDDKLERVMMDFMDGYYDVLLCTTIIETGLDIPNVNTLIVYDADHFGLAQLYQLRGRVGRSNRLAYAYFTYKKDRVLTEEAEKRLHAITEFTEFGSGFKIALRDLEIRGAGNLLGAEQHGHMAAVGYDMYCKLLEEAIAQLKGETPEEEIDTSIEIKLDAYIPDDYVPSEAQRIEIYKRIMSISDIEEEYDVEEEIEDRFGDIPQSVRNLLSIMHIKLLSKKIGIVSIEQKGHDIVFTLRDDKNIDLSGLIRVMDEYKGRVRFAATDQPSFYFNIGNETSEGILKDIRELLEKTMGLQAVAC